MSTQNTTKLQTLLQNKKKNKKSPNEASIKQMNETIIANLKSMTRV